jgi:hypothetical protein
MKTRKLRVWVLFGVLAASVPLDVPLQAASDLAPSGAVEPVPVPESEEQAGPDATGVGLSAAPAPDIPEPDVGAAGVEPSGAIAGQVTEADRPEEPTPAATGISQ